MNEGRFRPCLRGQTFMFEDSNGDKRPHVVLHFTPRHCVTINLETLAQELQRGILQHRIVRIPIPFGAEHCGTLTDRLQRAFDHAVELLEHPAAEPGPTSN